MSSEYVFRMETLLLLYALMYDEAYPVVCFDERPCFLIGEVVEGIGCGPEQVAKQHYAYSKHGSCVVMGAIEPLVGKRLLSVYEQRTKKEYTAFMQELAAAYPDAAKIRLVQDNLNTHTPNAFYECLSAEEAANLGARFELYYTPKCGSWLNMIEPRGRPRRVFGLVTSVFEPAYCQPGRIGKASADLGAGAESKEGQNQLAVHGGEGQRHTQHAVCEGQSQ